jgi:exonuclease VII large subunit
MRGGTADFNFGDLQTYGSIGAGNDVSNGLNFPLNGTQSEATSPTSATSPATPRTGEKRKSIVGFNEDGSARHAAEEDKRRRNTAASARFRVKKKQREQALEKTAREMSERANVLETKVHQLEVENQWLKGLITEREVGGDNKVNGVIGKGALEELFEKYKREEQSKSSDADGETDH